MNSKKKVFNKDGSFKKGHIVPKEWRSAVSKAQKGKAKSKEFKDQRRRYMEKSTQRKL